jgi:hypothetical protein
VNRVPAPILPNPPWVRFFKFAALAPYNVGRSKRPRRRIRGWVRFTYFACEPGKTGQNRTFPDTRDPQSAFTFSVLASGFWLLAPGSWLLASAFFPFRIPHSEFSISPRWLRFFIFTSARYDVSRRFTTPMRRHTPTPHLRSAFCLLPSAFPHLLPLYGAVARNGVDLRNFRSLRAGNEEDFFWGRCAQRRFLAQSTTYVTGST